MLTNPNLSQVTIPRNGFRLRRMVRLSNLSNNERFENIMISRTSVCLTCILNFSKGRNWNFLHLPTGSSSPLVDKEYFDYFLLQVFARDHISYFRETMLECSHNGCRGRYFHHGNILNLCLHEQEKSNASCCRMAIFNLSQQQSRCTEEFPLEVSSPHLADSGSNYEQASVCGCSSSLEHSISPSLNTFLSDHPIEVGSYDTPLALRLTLAYGQLLIKFMFVFYFFSRP